MNLFAQFQTFFGSIVFGMLSLLVWSLFNRIFYCRKIWPIRFIFEIGLLSSIAFLYYVFLSTFSLGVFNIFYILAFLLGMLIYYHFYAYNFGVLFNKICQAMYLKIIYPLKLKKNKFRDRLKSRKKEHGTKKIKKSKPIN